MERLQKYMAACGVASRRKSEQLIESGAVTVNGRVIKEMGYQVNPHADDVKVYGQRINTEEKIYILLNKPRGYVTTASDPQNRRIILDLLKDVQHRVYPVGRLDIDTSGLLILTNDGDLAQRLAHPSYEIDKVYLAKIKGIPDAAALEKLQSGIQLEDGITAPANARIIKIENNNAVVEITIHEGRNRQVRRMLDAIGHPVLRLSRERIGFLSVEGLKPGRYRQLQSEELIELKRMLDI
ncbi:pseudouridine synthase [Desulfuribacillus alkaliarsenatis]|uniref:Pseudouridine synthase n=1 Tax=Desulfuribacillus alkaliarsenatis TaxID=766136 RepID=A0A1E5G6R0_9FIRM|nr:pseudouridine synthase [Desulfuribacillus alkaliarsenatis]